MVCKAVQHVSDFFHDHLDNYVHWPDTKTEKTIKALPFYKKTKKPRCFGLVDGTHIPIGCPQGLVLDEHQYYCYKGYYSINTMVSSILFMYMHHMKQQKTLSCNKISTKNSQNNFNNMNLYFFKTEQKYLTHWYNCIFQIVGDYDDMVMHVNASNPGSCNDIYVMNGSQIKFLGDRADFKGYFLLGDSGYVLWTTSFTPHIFFYSWLSFTLY